jgi:phosphoribosyl-ATP pyrophosphohydrolase
LLVDLERLLGNRADAAVDESYTARLLADAPRKPAAKIVEEAGEVAVAALSESSDRLADEAADLVYHLLVLLRARDVPLSAVEARLAERHRR